MICETIATKRAEQTKTAGRLSVKCAACRSALLNSSMKVGTMSLQTRVDKLERQAGGEGCPECGYYAGAQVQFSIVTEPEVSARLEDIRCVTCGRSLVFTIDLGSARADA